MEFGVLTGEADVPGLRETESVPDRLIVMNPASSIDCVTIISNRCTRVSPQLKKVYENPTMIAFVLLPPMISLTVTLGSGPLRVSAVAVPEFDDDASATVLPSSNLSDSVPRGRFKPAGYWRWFP